MMFFSFFKRRFVAITKVKAGGDLLIDLLGDCAVSMATENTFKSAADGDGINHHHNRVCTVSVRSIPPCMLLSDEIEGT